MGTFVPFTCDEEVVAIGHGLMNRTLPKSAWTHGAHFATALWLLARYPETDALGRLRESIRAYNEATGVANTDSSGYHETITQASIRAARAFLIDSPPRPLFETCNALMASPLGESGWMLAYWSRSLLFSVDARRAWLDPDIKELPF